MIRLLVDLPQDGAGLQAALQQIVQLLVEPVVQVNLPAEERGLLQQDDAKWRAVVI